MANTRLADARIAKNDEFYTQYTDIEKEMNAYLEFDENVFRDQTVLLPCDDPEWSNFTKYFAQNFERLGLKKLISTSYASESKTVNILSAPTLFESTSPQFDSAKTSSRGKIFTLDRDQPHSGRIDSNDLQWHYLEGDGDFRSAEVRRLRDEADIIVTNPPFSLFREFLRWVTEGERKFVIIGSVNAITYKEVFPLIRDNRLWVGATNFNVGMYFIVPSDFTYAATYKFEREQNGVPVNRVPGVCWYTNLDHGRRHQPLSLLSEADNIKFSKHKEIRGVGYTKYDNYDAIEVPYTDAIPSDYPGLMGVPITFLDKYSPDQFEIVGITKTWDDESGLKIKTYPVQTQVAEDGTETLVGKLNDGAAIKLTTTPSSTHYKVKDAVLVQVYARILIKHKNPVT